MASAIFARPLPAARFLILSGPVKGAIVTVWTVERRVLPRDSFLDLHLAPGTCGQDVAHVAEERFAQPFGVRGVRQPAVG